MIEANGFLSVQIMMPVTLGTNLGEHNGIIDFKVCPLSYVGPMVVCLANIVDACARRGGLKKRKHLAPRTMDLYMAGR